MRSNRSHSSAICGARIALYSCIYSLFGTLLTLKLLWICEVLDAFFAALHTIFMTMLLLGLGTPAMAIATAFKYGFILLILYVLLHLYVIFYSEVGWLIFKSEAAVVIVELHCVLGYTYVKYHS